MCVKKVIDTNVSLFSGPKRYDFIDGTWIYKHDGIPLHDRLTKEISAALRSDVDFTVCSHGKRS